jgi:hypothetical protein
MFKMFGEKTPVQKYEKQAKKDAKEYGIKKDDVIRIDADLENEARNEAESIKGDAYHKRYSREKLNEIVDKIANSTLHFGEPGLTIFDDKGALKGNINGHEVKIKFAGENFNREIYCEIDGEGINDKDAWKIYKKYGDVASARSEALKDEKNRQNPEYLSKRKENENKLKDIL